MTFWIAVYCLQLLEKIINFPVSKSIECRLFHIMLEKMCGGDEHHIKTKVIGALYIFTFFMKKYVL